MIGNFSQLFLCLLILAMKYCPSVIKLHLVDLGFPFTYSCVHYTVNVSVNRLCFVLVKGANMF